MKPGEGAFEGRGQSGHGGVALVTGVTGQDGTHLVSDLISMGIRVVGLSRSFQGYIESNRVSVPVVALDYSEPGALAAFLDHLKPDFIFHLASNASSSHKETNSDEHWLVNVDVVSTFLDWIKRRTNGSTRFVQALSSEIFRGSSATPQSEGDSSSPTNPYGESKARARDLLADARSAGLHASGAILYNHESTLRPPNFVSRRITAGAARIALGLSEFLELRNLTDQRDWGHAADYTRAMVLMALHEIPAEYVVSSGQLSSVRRLCEVSFAYLGLDIGRVRVGNKDRDEFQVNNLHGNPAKIMQELGWMRDYSFEQMIEEMTEFDLRLLGATTRKIGFEK